MSSLIKNIYKESYNKNPSELLDDLKKTTMYTLYFGPWARILKQGGEAGNTDIITADFSKYSRYFPTKNSSIGYYPLIERKIYNSFRLKYGQAQDKDKFGDFNSRIELLKSSIDSNTVGGYLVLEKIKEFVKDISESNSMPATKASAFKRRNRMSPNDYLAALWAGMNVELVPISTFKQAHGEEFTIDENEKNNSMHLIQMSKSRIKSGISGASDIYKIHNIFRENVKGDTTNGKGNTINEIQAINSKEGNVMVASGIANAIKNDNRPANVSNN